MKKCILFLCALLLLRSLAGCGGQTSVDTGSPGDAQTDAPPEGQSLNYNADTVPETPVTATTPMVFVGGALYVSTGQVSDVEGRCGNMDGAITATVPATEIPHPRRANPTLAPTTPTRSAPTAPSRSPCAWTAPLTPSGSSFKKNPANK